MGEVPESEALNGKKTQTEYSPSERIGIRTARWRLIRKWLRTASKYPGRAGPAPSPKTCTYGSRCVCTTTTEAIATEGLVKLRGYCCDGQASDCYLYTSNGETSALWCKRRNGWAPTPCIGH